MPLDPENLVALGLNTPIPAIVNGKENGVNNLPEWEKDYQPCPEATLSNDMTVGQIRKLADWQESKVYPGTRRQIWIYHTPDLKADDQPRVMFFNDGAWYLSRSGPVQVTNVLNHMYATGQIGPTVAVFVTPGEPDHDVKGPIESYNNVLAQRSLEYDTVDARYGEFLFQELLPLSESVSGTSISKDPTKRLVCGISSGGIAAFSAAWFHPSECQRVLSHCGSFTDIWGGHNYPSMIRRTPRKPIRVFLQSGSNDANTPFGNWALANKTMASALEYAGYDFKFVFGVGGHSLNHGGAIFADSLRWLDQETV
jgi:enterochelin esterase family protein